MKKIRKRTSLTYFIVVILLVILISVMVTNLVLSFHYAERQYAWISALAELLVKESPGDEQTIMGYIKQSESTGEYESQRDLQESGNQYLLEKYGFRRIDFWNPYRNTAVISSVCCIAFFIILVILYFALIKKRIRYRIRSITEALVKANRGKEMTVLTDREDEFSVLEDELSKTMTEMKRTKEKALQERRNYADSLANIAHQIKTPITSMSLTVQQNHEESFRHERTKLKFQIDKINYLTDSLLTISKIDSGVLEYKKNKVDVYTLLELSLESLEEQIRNKKIAVEMTNNPEIYFIGDLDWSTEAFINLFKNCIEHMPEEGVLRIAYDKNPLYTEIVITDDGEGFGKRELPYLFKRFFTGGGNKRQGTGIGLSMAKSIIEGQNGFISAENTDSGGARFIVCFYCH